MLHLVFYNTRWADKKWCKFGFYDFQLPWIHENIALYKQEAEILVLLLKLYCIINL